MNQRGFSLTEALIAVWILAIALTAVLPTFLTYSTANEMNEERSGAVAVAQETVEALRQEDPSTLPTTGDSAVQTVTVGPRDYEVLTRYCVVSEYCGADSRHLIIEVGYGGRTVYSLETVYTKLR